MPLISVTFRNIREPSFEALLGTSVGTFIKMVETENNDGAGSGAGDY